MSYKLHAALVHSMPWAMLHDSRSAKANHAQEHGHDVILP